MTVRRIFRNCAVLHIGLNLLIACDQAEEPTLVSTPTSEKPTPTEKSPTQTPRPKEMPTINPDLEEWMSVIPYDQAAIEHFAKGLDYSDSGKFDLSIEEFNQAIAIEPQFALAFLMRGMAYLELGETLKGGADFERALELDPSLAETIDNIFHQILEEIGAE